MRYGSAAQGSLGSSLHQIFSHFTLCPIAAGPTANGLGCGRGSCSHVTCPFPATYPQGAHPRHARQESVANEDRHATSTFEGETADTLHPLPRRNQNKQTGIHHHLRARCCPRGLRLGVRVSRSRLRQRRLLSPSLPRDRDLDRDLLLLPPPSRLSTRLFPPRSPEDAFLTPAAGRTPTNPPNFEKVV